MSYMTSMTSYFFLTEVTFLLSRFEHKVCFFTARCYAERVCDIACRLSVRPSVRL